MALSSAQKAEILAMVASGDKIEAVKRFRELTGVGLKEALVAVTQMSAAHAVRAPHGSNTHTPLATARSMIADINPKARQQAEAAALAALRDGNVMEAIKQYQKHAKAGLKDSKDAVDALSVVHHSEGRINSKVATVLVGLMRQGKTQDAVTHLMSNVGLDEPDAREILKKLKRAGAGRSGCGCSGCFSGMFVLFVLALIAVAVIQVGCTNMVRNSSLYQCLEFKALTNPVVQQKLGPDVAMSPWMFVQSWSAEGPHRAFRAYGQLKGAKGESGVWLEAENMGSEASGIVTLSNGDARVFAGAFKCEP